MGFSRRIRRRSEEFVPQEPVPDIVPDAPADGAGENNLEAIRETIDLLEADLAAMIRDVHQTAGAVQHGIAASALALTAIRRHSEALAGKTRGAREDSLQLATATEEFTASASEILRQVREAGEVAESATQAAQAAAVNVDALKSSSDEIGKVTGLIASIAKQTNLLALNAKIEAARAGESGRAFAIVANEVKELSAKTQDATKEIAEKVAMLQRDTAKSIAAIDQINAAIGTLRPMFDAVAGAVDEQNTTTTELARSATETSRFVASVADGANDIVETAAIAATHGEAAGRSGQDAAKTVEKLQSRFVMLLRQTEFGDRRRHDRLPCDLSVVIRSGVDLRGQTVDLSEGGVLVKFSDGQKIETSELQASISGIGDCRVRAVNQSHLGLHLEFLEKSEVFQKALDAKLAAIWEANREYIQRAIEAAERIAEAFENAVSRGVLTREALFDNRYESIEGTDPRQFRTRFLSALENILPPIQEPLLESDPRMVFCAAVDRNGYLGVHNNIYSQPQRPDDPIWNTANSRNRRIFDDRAGLSAARNVRRYLLQNYPREMGNGVVVLMQEIDVPIRVFGKHWGGFRTAYKS